VPSVVTVFDCIAWSHPELLPRRVVRAFRTASARALPAADHVIAISQSSAAQVRRWFPHCSRVSVAPCGLSRELAAIASAASTPADRRGVLFVGTIEPRKNVPLVVGAARRLRHVPFTLVGKPGWGGYDLAREIADLPNVTWLSQADDERLARAYRNAALFVYPSRVEGFGLPVLEAIAYGALPIVSTDAALTELVPDPALCVDIDKSDSLARAIDHWLARPDEAKCRVEVLAAHATQFTWKNGARVVLSAIERAGERRAASYTRSEHAHPTAVPAATAQFVEDVGPVHRRHHDNVHAEILDLRR
jgi:glycosyltransferase involved in cell wall biosynthesis